MNNTNQSDEKVLLLAKQAIAAVKSGNRPLARLNLENVVTTEYDNPNYWLWVAWTADSPAGMISALEQALILDPNHSLAQLGLEWATRMQNYDPDEYAKSGFDRDERYVVRSTPIPDDSQAKAEVDESDHESPSFESSFESSTVDPVARENTDRLADAELTSDDGVATDQVFEGGPQPDASDAQGESGEMTAEADQVEEHTLESIGALQGMIETDGIETDRSESHDPQSELPPEASSEHDAHVPPEDREAIGSDEPTESGGPITILAVDDSPTIRKIVSMSFERLGYNVVTACNGMEALKRMNECTPTLVLTDISMPQIDGYQLCKLIKSHAKTRDIPVIMLSGKDGMFDKIKGRFVGCDDYITKPFQSTELLDKVASYLPEPVSKS